MFTFIENADKNRLFPNAEMKISKVKFLLFHVRDAFSFISLKKQSAF